MSTVSPPESLVALFEADHPLETRLQDLMPLLCQVLSCDRCLLFLRDPVTRRSACPFGWWSRSEYEYSLYPEGEIESATLGQDDPLFGEALRNPEALYIEDIETAGPEVLKREFERQYFGHRALIHAPIYAEAGMVGILEPCVMAQPRVWTASDRQVIAWLQHQLAPLAVTYVQQQLA